jgi:hypothetical protein
MSPGGGFPSSGRVSIAVDVVPQMLPPVARPWLHYRRGAGTRYPPWLLNSLKPVGLVQQIHNLLQTFELAGVFSDDAGRASLSDSNTTPGMFAFMVSGFV